MRNSHTHLIVHSGIASALSIGSTANTAGVVTTILPSTVFAKSIDQNQFQLFSRPEYVATAGNVNNIYWSW